MRHPDQPVRLVRHEQRDVQHVAVQLQVVQGKANAQFDFLREQLLELPKAAAGSIGLGLTSTGKISFSRWIRKSTS